MTRQTTALLMAGPRYTGSFADRAYRLALCAQLIEGSDPAYWLTSPTPPALHVVEPDIVEVDVPFSESLVDSAIFLLAAHLGDASTERLLLESHLISVEDDVRRIAPYWAPLADDVCESLAKHLGSYLRLGITLLEDVSLFDQAAIDQLRIHFDLDVFTLSSSAIPTTP